MYNTFDIISAMFISGFLGFILGFVYLLRRIRKNGFQDSTHTFTATERPDNIKDEKK